MPHSQAQLTDVMQALRHAAALSCEPYIWGAAKLATLAVTQREYLDWA